MFCMKQKLGKARNLALPRLENPIQSYKYKATAGAAAGDKLSRPSVRRRRRETTSMRIRGFLSAAHLKNWVTLRRAAIGIARAPCYVAGIIQRSFYWIFSVKSSAKQKLYSSLVRSEREGSSLCLIFSPAFLLCRDGSRDRVICTSSRSAEGRRE